MPPFDTPVCHKRQICLRFPRILKVISEMAFRHIAHRFESWIAFLWPSLAKLHENALMLRPGLVLRDDSPLSSHVAEYCAVGDESVVKIATPCVVHIPGGGGGGGGGGGTRPENWWGCAAGRWKLDPKRSRKKLNLGPKRSIFGKIGSFCTPKDSFAVGGWEKYPKKIVLDPAKVKKGGQNRGTYVSPIT